MFDAEIYVAGEPVRTDGSIDVVNPYDQSVLGSVPACSADDVDRACAHAQAVLDRGDFPQHERAEVLERAAALLRDRTEHFGQIIAHEAGKPIRTSRVEAQRCVDTLVYSAVEARRLSGEIIPMEGTASGAGRIGLALRVPIGVVAAISPFNFPLNLVAHKIAPAIAAGCPVVLKPASATPFSAIELVALLREAGMPADWISVVTGSGKEVGNVLVEHPVPRLISFTGSPDVGWGIAARAPKKKVSLELGSTSPCIVEADADLETVVAKIRVAGFSHAGQSCISTQRVFVQRDVHDELVGQLGAGVSSLVVGDPLDEATDVGPLIDRGETERVRSWIADAVAAGGTLVCGGEVVDGLLQPAVVDEPPRHVDLCAREVFGPVVTVAAYDSFEQAIELANDADFGLHAGVFTRDVTKALAAARKLEFGGVLVNDVPTYRADQQPYGGVKESGNTREGPAFAVEEMTELRFVGINP